MKKHIILNDIEKKELFSMSQGEDSRLADRASSILLFEKGESLMEISQITGLSKPTILKWRRRYLEQGLSGLKDGRKAKTDSYSSIVELREKLGLSQSALGKILQVDNSIVSRYEAGKVKPRGLTLTVLNGMLQENGLTEIR